MLKCCDYGTILLSKAQKCCEIGQIFAKIVLWVYIRYPIRQKKTRRWPCSEESWKKEECCVWARYFLPPQSYALWWCVRESTSWNIPLHSLPVLGGVGSSPCCPESRIWSSSHRGSHLDIVSHGCLLWMFRLLRLLCRGLCWNSRQWLLLDVCLFLFWSGQVRLDMFNSIK